ncbi:MAG: PP2C family protein-serine/threonine phosphatase [Candidatus Rifleibacteriota bacterium]
MQDKAVKQSYSQRFPVLSFLGIVFCFILFPAGLINLGLDQVLRIKADNSREQLEDQITQVLKTVERFADNEIFVHQLLLQVNNRLLRSRNPEKTFRVLKNHLQKKYPDAFTFVYWNGRGEQIKDLSDENSYGYIIKKTFQSLKRASELLGNWDEKHEEVTLGTLADVDKDLKILRNFLGKLLVTYQLRYPWMSGRLGKPLQTAPPGPRSRIWYRINENSGFLCFINDRFIQGSAGAKFALDLVKKKYPLFTAHLSRFPADGKFFPPARADMIPRLVVALSKFESLSPAKFERIGDYLVSCGMVGQRDRVVCYCPASLLFSPLRAKWEILGKILGILLPVFFVGLIWFKTRRETFVSIRFKLVGVFLYACGIPLLIMASVGFEYIEQKKAQMVYDAQTRGINVLNNIDRNFTVFLSDQSEILNNYFKKLNKEFGQKIIEPANLERIRKEVLDNSQPESLQIIDEKGQQLVRDSEKTIFTDYTITSQIALEILKVVNSSDENEMENNLLSSEKIGLNKVTSKKRINYVGIGAHELYHFFDFLGNPDKYQNLAAVQLFWRLERLQRTFFEKFERLRFAGKKEGALRIIAYYSEQDLLSENLSDNDFLKNLGQQAFSTMVFRKDRLRIGEIDYLGVGMRGLNLNKISLLYFFPLEEIENSIDELEKQLIFSACIFMLVALLMFRFLADKFIGPVSEIENAIDSIDRRDFSYRLHLDASMEFTELAQTFNSSLETLKDLETAKIVQENLMPLNEASIGKMFLVANSTPYSRIGGDYFDFFTISDSRLGVFIGDVSGHGISAALIMAMAKAAVIFEKNDFVSIEKAINSLDQMIFLNRKTGTREYMTGVMLEVDGENGNMSVLNRGHCMPCIISADGKRIEDIRCGGLPLGYNAPDKNRMIKVDLKPGETVCLFTDGLVEARDADGETLGYEGFKKLLLENWGKSVKEHLEAVLGAHSKAASGSEDDRTLILLRFENL